MALCAKRVRWTAFAGFVLFSLLAAICAFPQAAHAEWRGYDDVPADHWAAKSGIVDWSMEHQAVTGYDKDTWDPDGECTRGMAVTIVWRLEGKPEAKEVPSFSDVSKDDWFASAVEWAASEGIVSGYDDGRFDPNAPITREQVAKITALWCGVQEDGLQEPDLSAFADPASVSEWALGYVGWAADNGVLRGQETASGLLISGQDGCTRAEFATLMARVVDGVKEGVDVSNLSYEVEAEYTPCYQQVEVPVYEDQWVDSNLPCYLKPTATIFYCVACGVEYCAYQTTTQALLLAKKAEVDPADWPQYRFIDWEDDPGTYWVVLRPDVPDYHIYSWPWEEVNGLGNYYSLEGARKALREHIPIAIYDCEACGKRFYVPAWNSMQPEFESTIHFETAHGEPVGAVFLGRRCLNGGLIMAGPESFRFEDGVDFKVSIGDDPGHWEQVQVGTETQTVDVGGTWSFSGGRWV